ncbi:hypothetical protein M231_07051 [Tremella mesenterica]|uniref:Autophagy-related protein 14 n=1 Tax=Tremella mesenterica TaxID=5217 RepID=A0A4Q1BA77_TREME|nr:hypothetical protein M231_07051 [Tremella mesenterica]
MRTLGFYVPTVFNKGDIATHDAFARSLQQQTRDAEIKAERRLHRPKGLEDWRKLRAEVAISERRVAKLKARLAECEDVVKRIETQNRPVKRSKFSKPSISPSPRSFPDLTKFFVRARVVLIREAINVFGLRRRSTGEWEIAGNVLPPSDEFRQYPSSVINAALVHTVHLLSLLTSYLSIALPYIPTTSKPHLGRPVMKPNLPFVATTKYRDRNVLWMSSTAHKIDSSKALAKHHNFLTAFALLAHSVAYLAWSQGVEGIGVSPGIVDSDDDETPASSAILIPATNILQLIHELADSPQLGLKSHEPGTVQMRHLGFGLDVSRVVRSVLRSEERYSGHLSEGWDMVDSV